MNKSEKDNSFDLLVRTNFVMFRQQSGMNAAELSIKAGLNRRAVQDYEEGSSQSPKLSTIYKLTNALGISIDELIAGRRRTELNHELQQWLESLSQAQAEGLMNLVPATSHIHDTDETD
ncbi:helix-turn-helix domain-containing protein [Halovulum sp. GXIMD14793]